MIRREYKIGGKVPDGASHPPPRSQAHPPEPPPSPTANCWREIADDLYEALRVASCIYDPEGATAAIRRYEEARDR